MAPPVGTLRVGRYFLALLAILAVLYAIVFWPGQRNTPKLGIDLVGGTQVVFTARTDNGSTPSRSSMDQARQIISDRVNGTGVTQATVVIQGDNQLVVSIPGQDATDIQKLGAAAILNFRGVVAPAVQVSCTSAGSPSGSGSSSASASSGPSAPASSARAAQPSSSGAAGTAHAGGLLRNSPAAAAALAAPVTSPKPGTAKPGTAKPAPAGSKTTTPATTPPASTSPSASAAPSSPASTACLANPLAQVAQAGKFSVPLSDTDYAKLSSTNQQLIAAALARFDCSSAQTEKDDPASYYVACDENNQYAYLLGTVIVAGKQISDAAAVAPNPANGQTEWTVSLDLKPSGQTRWADYTSKHNIGGRGATSAAGVTACSATTTPCADYVSFTLDGSVISSPVNESTINGGTTQISGGFTSSTANDLANKLKYGALPLNFKTETAQAVSATLGTEQLKSGLLAGGIGLVLVIVYSLIYYRALGLVTIASLIVSGVLTYGALVMLATQIGFTLSLAGIAGFIIAVGITADSFVVFFERVKDEVHGGRSVRVAVPRAWVRARRTILSADTVSFLAAAILYYFTTDEVRGFAFTLGLSTILDLVVVFLFTHPLVSWLSRLRTFGSAGFTGLDAVRVGPAISDEASDSDAAGRPRARRSRPAARSGRVATLEAPDTASDPTIATERDMSDSDADDDLTARPSRAGTTTSLAKVLADESPAAEPADEPGAEPGAERADGPAGSPDDDLGSIAATDPDEPPAPRRRTTPAPGSAAERAAARRARLRGKQSGDEEGQS